MCTLRWGKIRDVLRVVWLQLPWMTKHHSPSVASCWCSSQAGQGSGASLILGFTKRREVSSNLGLPTNPNHPFLIHLFISSWQSGIIHDFLGKNSPWASSHKPKKCQRCAESTVQPPSEIKWENHIPHRSVSAIQEEWVTFWMPRTHYRTPSSVFKFLTSYFFLLG